MAAEPPRGAAALPAGRTALLVAALGLHGCGEHQLLDVGPAPPDMSELVARFAEPTADFDQASAEAVLQHYGALARRVVEVDLVAQLSRALELAAREAEARQSTGVRALGAEPSGPRSPTLEPARFEATGSVDVERLCDGWGPAPAPELGNGRLVGHLRFTERGLEPTVWASAEACRFLVEGVRIQLGDAAGEHDSVRLWLGHGAGFAGAFARPLLFDVALTTEVAGVEAALRLGFRVDPSDDTLTFAIDLPGEPPRGAVLVSARPSGPLRVAARNGSFECSASTRQCTSDTAAGFTF